MRSISIREKGMRMAVRRRVPMSSSWSRMACILKVMMTATSTSAEQPKVGLEPYAPDQVDAAGYARAARILDAGEGNAVRNASVVPNWMGGGRFWYRKETAKGAVFQIVDARTTAVDMCGAIPLMMDKRQGPSQGDSAYCDPIVLAKLAPNLKGKLLLAYGDMDEHVPPASMIQFVDALTRANRDYDLIVMPNRAHGFSQDRYFSRRLFDYFVRHLMGSEPPPNASLSPPVK